MVKNIYKEAKNKLALKHEGHSLIDRIKWKGYSKDEVYIMLAKELDIDEPHAHFARMQTLRELRPAVDALQRILDKVPKTEFAMGRKRPRAEPARNIIRVADQVELKGVGLYKPKKPVQVKKVGKRLAEKQKNTLPREKVLEVLEQMKRDRLAREGITLYDDKMNWMEDVRKLPPSDDKTVDMVIGNYDELYGGKVRRILYKIKRFLWR